MSTQDKAADQAHDDDTTSREQYRRMFLAACTDLGLVNEALGLDPDDGGAEPIIDAIKELKQLASTQQAEPAQAATPFAWAYRAWAEDAEHSLSMIDPAEFRDPDISDVVPLYTHPAPAQAQLSDEQIEMARLEVFRKCGADLMPDVAKVLSSAIQSACAEAWGVKLEGGE
jgi:hypothetical protein